jgi:hypothetical protein
VAGETDPERLLALVHRRVRAEPARLRAALSGRVSKSHRFLLRLHLGQYDALAKALEEIDAEVERGLDPFRDAVHLLRTVPGIGDLSARPLSRRSAPTWAASPPLPTSSPGLAYVPAATRARASAAPRGCARARPG